MKNVFVAIIVTAALIGRSYATQPLVECSYSLPKSGKRVFVQSTAEAQDWPKRMAADHSIPDWNSGAECHALDGKNATWTLFVQTENGRISLQYGITQKVCEEVLYSLQVHCNNCSFMVQGSDYRRGECFQ